MIFWLSSYGQYINPVWLVEGMLSGTVNPLSPDYCPCMSFTLKVTNPTFVRIHIPNMVRMSEPVGFENPGLENPFYRECPGTSLLVGLEILLLTVYK